MGNNNLIIIIKTLKNSPLSFKSIKILLMDVKSRLFFENSKRKFRNVIN